MFDSILGFYRRVFRLIGRVSFVTLALGILVYTSYAAVAHGIGDCYFKESCKTTGDYTVFVIPVLVLIGEVYVWKKWDDHKSKESPAKSDRTASKKSTAEQTVSEALETRSKLTLSQLASVTKISEDKLAPIIGKLLRSQAVTQSTKNGITTFSLASRDVDER